MSGMISHHAQAIVMARMAPTHGASPSVQTLCYFSPRRPFLLPTWVEPLAGKPVVFALNTWWAKYHQVDRGVRLPAHPEEF